MLQLRHSTVGHLSPISLPQSQSETIMSAPMAVRPSNQVTLRDGYPAAPKVPQLIGDDCWRERAEVHRKREARATGSVADIVGGLKNVLIW